jgi:hypothetical protein
MLKELKRFFSSTPKSSINIDIMEWYKNYYLGTSQGKSLNLDILKFKNLQILHENGHKSIEKFLGHKKIYIKVKDLTVCIDTSLEAFLRLGDYNVDKVSCFRCGNLNEKLRYDFAITPNTFVITVQHTNYNGYVSRMIGFFDSNFTIMNVFGLFNKFKVVNTDISLGLVKELMAFVIKDENISHKENNIDIFGRFYTHNPMWSIYSKTLYGFEGPDKQYLFAKTSDI